MSQASGKQVMSGLRTVKRDFSSNSLPPNSQNAASGGSSRQQKLSTQEERLKLIQDALNGVATSGDNKSPFSSSNAAASGGSSMSSASLKRPSPDDSHSGVKKRRMPSSWNDSNDIASYSNTRTLSVSTSINTASKTTIPTTSAKPASIFLSQEQTHILKLVENGESIFYTGSAGEFYVLLTNDRFILPRTFIDRFKIQGPENLCYYEKLLE